MKKLWLANMMRLKKSKTLWIFTVMIFVITLWYITKGWSLIGIQQAAGGIHNYVMFIVGMVPAFLTLFVSTFLGTEYSDKTVRNKLVAGYTRKEVYLAYLFTSYVAMVIFMAAWFAGTISGMLLLGKGIDWLWLINTTILALFFSAAFVSFLVLFSVLIQNKALAIIIEIEFARISLMIPLIGFTIGSTLGGIIGKGILYLNQILPMGQWMYATEILQVPVIPTAIRVCLSAIVMVLLAVAGVTMFEKKEIS